MKKDMTGMEKERKRLENDNKKIWH